uniref:RNA editing complex protein MP46 n=1 Tax=Trypanosoma congolense (strain IL3000) TaxID=1068625 RepID=G0UZR2_TRYCI|nr:RNA editing complex protein MP46 [Trypanosoma congolense IL3000]
MLRLDLLRRPLDLRLHMAGVGFTSAAAFYTARRMHTCQLCDVSYDSWGDHAQSASHVARHVICKTFVSPERHSAVMQQLWKHIRLDFGYVDEVTQKKEDRRRNRLASTLRHLQEKGVVCHSVPRVVVDAEGETSLLVDKDRFINLMFVGESFARQETLDRVARLMPRAEAVELSSVVSYLLSKRRLAHLFDLLDMRSVVLSANRSAVVEEGDGRAPPVPRMRQDEKAIVVYSCLGELHMFSRQDRSHSVATRAAAEQLVLNVLGTHVMENAIAELVHESLQRVVEEGTPVWRAHCSELKHKMFEGTRTPAPALATAPSPTSQLPAVVGGDQLSVDLYRLYALAGDSESRPQLSTTKRQVWHDVTRSLVLELTVPNPINKSAVFAPVLPRLVAKK